MSEDDRRRVLRMVAAGLISVEEGAELLDALPSERRPVLPENEYTIREEVPEPVATLPPAARTISRSLVIRVAEGDKSKVNLRIPLGLARAAGKFIPRHARHDLGKRGIDLGLLIEGISAEMRSGPLIEVNDGDDVVYIGVE